MAKHSEIIERLEKLTGPDRELDLHIARALCPDVIVLRQRDDDSGADPFTHWEYTASLDAAIALCERVLPGWARLIECIDGIDPKYRMQPCNVQLWLIPARTKGWPKEHFDGDAPTAPLALLIALLRALQAKDGEG